MPKYGAILLFCAILSVQFRSGFAVSGQEHSNPKAADPVNTGGRDAQQSTSLPKTTKKSGIGSATIGNGVAPTQEGRRKKKERNGRRGPANGNNRLGAVGGVRKPKAGNVFGRVKQNPTAEARVDEGEGMMCGDVAVHRMDSAVYTSEFYRERKTVKFAREHIARGSFGRIHVGYYVRLEHYEIVGKCVAVKIGMPGVFMNAKDVIGAIRRLAPERKEHLIETFDIRGRTTADEELIVMEFGVESLEERIYGATRETLAEPKLAEMVKVLAHPLREMHQVAMHLDMKPQNVMFVGETLKIIDFDGAVLLPGLSGREANLPLESAFGLYTLEYASPESLLSKKLSTKADMFALGIMVYELLLAQKRFWPDGDIEKDTVESALLSLASLHRGFYTTVTRNASSTASTDSTVSMASTATATETVETSVTISRALSYNDYDVASIASSLSIWREYPHIAPLLTNLLSPNTLVRMTASGVLAYLVGNCYPKELKTFVNNVKIFNQMKVVELKRWLRHRLELARESLKRVGPLLEREQNKDAANAKSDAESSIRYSFSDNYQREKEALEQEVAKWAGLETLLKGAIDARVMHYKHTNARRKPNCDTETTKY